MPVAPSFQNYKRISEEPFLKGAKYYVTIEHPSTHNRRDVRWYSDSEYAKAYGSKLTKPTDDGFDGLKQARGFASGPILVIRRNRASDEEWLSKSCARYAVGIGWYIVSTETLPEDAPEHFKYLLLSWEEFKGEDERHGKTPTQLAEILDQKMRNKEWFNII